MNQDEIKATEEEIKRQKEAEESELSDSELQQVAGGGKGGHGDSGGTTILPLPPTTI